MENIENLRKKIDVINTELVELLISRFEISEKIGEEKNKIGKEVFDIRREEEIFLTIGKKIGNNKYKMELKDIFKEILKKSKEIQKRG